MEGLRCFGRRGEASFVPEAGGAKVPTREVFQEAGGASEAGEGKWRRGGENRRAWTMHDHAAK